MAVLGEQSWARDNFVASRRRQRDKVMKLQRLQNIKASVAKGVATTNKVIMP